jgi:hypothetical protein
MNVITNMYQNEKLYKEITDLIGLYLYTKNKINIKLYVINYYK